MELNDFLLNGGTPESDSADHQISAEGPEASKSPEYIGRVIRRRARKACIGCNKRKVRCDVSTTGQSCTNCRLDGFPCVVRTKDRRRRKHDDVQETLTDQPLPPKQADFLGISNAPNSPKLQENFAYACPQFRKPLTPSFPIAFGASGNLDMIFSYYEFLDGESQSHIPPEDFKFLENKGCFHLPPRSILDEFIWHYFLYVHPVLPILDEKEFWEMYLANGCRQTRRIPLFLFRAMIFASCSFISLETLKLMGFQGPFDARAALYQRTKLLYDFGAASDRIAISQGALLLTYYSSDREPLLNTCWLRTAIQYATSENVHMYNSDPNLTQEDKLARKRLWWCIVLRDRIQPLGLRRPIQITHDTFDFLEDIMTEKDFEGEFNHSQVYDTETKRSLARIFISQITLAIVLTDILALIYPIKSLNAFDFSTLMSMPSKIQTCREGLDRWSNDLEEIPSTEFTLSNRHDSIILFRGITQIYYHSARAALAQYESFALQADMARANLARTRELGSELHSAIAIISNIVGKLVEIDMAKYLPISAVAYLTLPIILNSIDVQGKSSATFRNESKRRQLRRNNEAMDICCARYGAGMSSIVIKNTLASAKSEVGSGTNLQSQANTAIAPIPAAGGKIDDWYEVFVSKPKQYLRLAMSIDISFSLGRYPSTTSLPNIILLSDSAIPLSSIPRSLSTPVMSTAPLCDADMELSSPKALDILDRRRDLDFFDFNSASSDVRSEQRGPWDEDTVEIILEEALRLRPELLLNH